MPTPPPHACSTANLPARNSGRASAAELTAETCGKPALFAQAHAASIAARDKIIVMRFPIVEGYHLLGIKCFILKQFSERARTKWSARCHG